MERLVCKVGDPGRILDVLSWGGLVSPWSRCSSLPLRRRVGSSSKWLQEWMYRLTSSSNFGKICDVQSLGSGLLSKGPHEEVEDPRRPRYREQALKAYSVISID